VSAPIQIGRRVTVGGGSRVSLGCVVGDDAVIESGAVLPPFTVVPEGEVWAGNPVCCQRKRQDQCEAPLAPAATVITSEIAELVERALDVRTDLPWAEWSTDTIAQWDSLGQIAIAAALFDRYGMTVSASDLFRLRSLQDIAGLVSNHRSPASRIEDTKLAI